MPFVPHAKGFYPHRRGAPFSPDDIPGLALWLNGDNVHLTLGSLVDTMYDLSGNARHATQASTLLMPDYGSSINGVPAILFDGVDEQLLTPAFTTFPAKRGVLYLALQSGFPVSFATPISTRPGTSPWWEVYSSQAPTGSKAKWSSDGVDVNATNYDDVLPTVQALRRTADTTLKFYHAGTLEDTFTVPAQQPASNAVILGGGLAGSAFHGLIGEVLLYDTELTDTQHANVTAWLMAKYSL